MAAIPETETPSARVNELAGEYDAVNLGCGTDHRDGMLNVDAVPECQPDLVVDLNERRWPFPDNSFDRVLASHVLEHLDDPAAALQECARILRKDGTLDVRLPIGLDLRADPDHETDWTWLTPEFYTGARHWDTDVNLEVIERDVELWSALPGIEHYLYQAYLNWRLRKFGPGRWCFDLPAVSGEYTIRFRRDTE